MFERFNEDARQAVVYAQEEARTARHPDIGAEHLLLGVLRAARDTSQAQTVVGMTLQDARERVLAARPPGSREPSGHIPFTPNGKAALELAHRASLDLDQQHISAAHVLMGVLAAHDPTVEQAFTAAHLDVSEVMERARTWAGTTRPEEARRHSNVASWFSGTGRGARPRHTGQVSAQAAGLARKAEILADALRRYGRHESGCPAADGATACTCGLEAALAAADDPDAPSA